MAFLAPLAGAGLTAGGMATASAVFGGLAAIQSGYAQKQAYKDQAAQTESAAKDRELMRLQSLRSALASQRAHWASSGVSSASGSPMTIADNSFQNYTLERGADHINTRSQIRTLNNSANSAVTSGWIKAGSSLLSNY